MPESSQKLTSKQEAFAQAIADGMNQSDAYRKAYNAGSMKYQTINSKSCILLKDGKVMARVDQLRKKIESRQLWTREDSIKTLKSVVEESERSGDKVSAVKELNAMHGFNAPTKTEMTIDFPKVINVIAGRA